MDRDFIIQKGSSEKWILSLHTHLSEAFGPPRKTACLVSVSIRAREIAGEPMKILYSVHVSVLGRLEGRNPVAFFTAAWKPERRGQTAGISHGPVTGRGEASWRGTFSHIYPLARKATVSGSRRHFGIFSPMQLRAQNLGTGGPEATWDQVEVPVMRIVHDMTCSPYAELQVFLLEPANLQAGGESFLPVRLRRFCGAEPGQGVAVPVGQLLRKEKGDSVEPRGFYG